MTQAPVRAGLRRMIGRDPDEKHRVATPLELLFDLTFVVAVSQASQNLHHLMSDGLAGDAVLAYAMVFFAVWWAWVNFTWFASAFDTDDWLYRVVTIVQMGGVLVLSAGVHAAMVDQDYRVVTWGYVIMRLAMVTQWLRVAASDPAARRTALRFAAGICVVQVLWVARLLMLDDSAHLWSFAALMAIELAVPVWSEARGRTHWHPHHIAERYGLFTLLLLGESLLASAGAIIDALGEGEHPELLWLAVAGLVITAGIWWIYFAREQHDDLTGMRAGFVFGYWHYLIFASVGAFSAGVEVEVDRITGTTGAPPVVAGMTLALPVALFLVSVWVLMLRTRVSAWASVVTLAAAAAIAAAGVSSMGAEIVTAGAVVIVVVALETDAARAGRVRPLPTARSAVRGV